MTFGGKRSIRYYPFGDPDADAAVLYCHGGLMSGWDAAVYDGAARDRGIRILSPDRPGVGGSDRRPGGSLLAWAREDARAILDAEHVQDAVVAGWSAGGQYALAVAREADPRIRGAVVIAGALPLTDPATFRELNRMDRRLIRLARTFPAGAGAWFRFARTAARRAPTAFRRSSGRALGPEDAAALARHADWYQRSSLDALRQIGGAVDEYRVFGADWGFEPADVAVPVTILQGEEDRLIRPDWADRMARAMPAATVVTRPGCGHLVGASDPDWVMARIRDAYAGGTPS